MKAKDIMSKKQIQDWIDDRFGIPNTVDAKCFQDFAVLVSKISFKAGVKEVVDYVSTYRDENSYDEYWGFYVIDPEDWIWIERLKEWGIEGENRILT